MKIINMNKILIENNENRIIDINTDSEITLLSGKSTITLYLKDNKYNLDFILKEDTELITNILSIDTSLNINVKYEGENSSFILNNSTINYKDSKLNLNINHNYKCTKSNVINHGINVNNGNLFMEINAKVEKGAEKAELYQDNKIINLKDGKGLIRPNLLIDEYDSVANHSAYISKFKLDDMFYLMSRGINENDSTKLLTKSFLLSRMDIDEKIKSKYIEEINNIERG